MGQINIVLSFRGAQVTLMKLVKKFHETERKDICQQFLSSDVGCQNTPEARCLRADHLEDHPVPQQDDV